MRSFLPILIVEMMVSGLLLHPITPMQHLVVIFQETSRSTITLVLIQTPGSLRVNLPSKPPYHLHDFYDAISAGNFPAVTCLKAAGYQDGHAGYSRGDLLNLLPGRRFSLTITGGYAPRR